MPGRHRGEVSNVKVTIEATVEADSIAWAEEYGTENEENTRSDFEAWARSSVQDILTRDGETLSPRTKVSVSATKRP